VVVKGHLAFSDILPHDNIIMHTLQQIIITITKHVNFSLSRKNAKPQLRHSHLHSCADYKDKYRTSPTLTNRPKDLIS